MKSSGWRWGNSGAPNDPLRNNRFYGLNIEDEDENSNFEKNTGNKMPQSSFLI